MLLNITYFLIFGKPLIMWLGLLTLLSFLLTATLGYLVFKGHYKPPLITLKMHRCLACFSIGLALIHGTLGLLIYFPIK
ncbi:MAG TPA: hypothetical protein VMD74_05220 [Candidatus Methylomirabilis sp.]|nr:hypothetical protein [Candidatus Methylomirabilis sp.]